MTAKYFVDTNVLIYASSNAAAEQSRRVIALQLLDRSDLALSAQVLAEFYSVATSKTKLNLTQEEAVLLLEGLARFPVCPSRANW
jgi:predicted nucleic acid-binding protein